MYDYYVIEASDGDGNVKQFPIPEYLFTSDTLDEYNAAYSDADRFAQSKGGYGYVNLVGCRILSEL